MEEKDFYFENYTMEEMHEMDEYSMLSEEIDSEGEIFQDKLDMYRNEI